VSSLRYRTAVLVFLCCCAPAAAEPPTPVDPRLVLELVAAEPDIVTPTGLTVDEEGRVWVLENNTHERPKEYKGPTSDRVRVFDDFDPRTGRARRIRTFADGFRNAMGIGLGPDGVVFVATRSDIYQLRDTQGTGTADERKVLVRLATHGTYPHNGLSGFAFDGLGWMYFGLGENLGEPYWLIGADRITFKGGGEGGSVYRCHLDGTGLERLATGFWNPFHQCFDAFGRLWVVDNDPDARGPCRLLHVVPGGDYGYRFRYGRKGLHPFTAWNGELPGTLPMTAGTAEAPSGVVAYEAAGLPAEYRGQLLSTSWGDHVVERFSPTPHGASFTAQAKTLVRGGEDFRPVGIAVAPDGAVYVSDWVDKSYPVHGKGRIWRLRMKESPPAGDVNPAKLADADIAKLKPLLGHPRREVRAAAAAALAGKGAAGRAALAEVLGKASETRARVQALWGLARLDPAAAREAITRGLEDRTAEVRGEAARLLGELPLEAREDATENRLLERALKDESAFVRAQAVRSLRSPRSLEAVVPMLGEEDSYLVSAALNVLGQPGQTALLLAHFKASEGRLRVGIALALRQAGEAAGREVIPELLKDADPGARRLAVQWVAEERLPRDETSSRNIEEAVKASLRPPVTRDLLEAFLAAQDLLSDRPRPSKDEVGGEEYVAAIVQDAKYPAPVRALALRMLPPESPRLHIADLRGFLKSDDAELRHEAARALAFRTEPAALEALVKLAGDAEAETALRSEAVLGLARQNQMPQAVSELLLGLLDQPALRRDALRSLRGAAQEPAVQKGVLNWWDRHLARDRKPTEEDRELAEQVVLLFGARADKELARRLEPIRVIAGARPDGPAAWRAALQGTGDAVAGEHVFFHPQGPRCFACHRVDGRGAQVGPDLSRIGASTGREKLIESILEPSKEIAPQYTTWIIVTRDGRQRTGVIVGESFDSTITVADTQGKKEVLKRLDIEERTASPVSIMPADLHALLTRREFLDLLAYLQARK
jgi:putative membrane-bound dehydrogenase-like protein